MFRSLYEIHVHFSFVRKLLTCSEISGQEIISDLGIIVLSTDYPYTELMTIHLYLMTDGHAFSNRLAGFDIGMSRYGIIIIIIIIIISIISSSITIIIIQAGLYCSLCLLVPKV